MRLAIAHPRETLRLVITIGGLHGTGKSTYARNLSRFLNLRRISAGEMFRKLADERGVSLGRMSKIAQEQSEIDKLIDSRIREEAEKGSVVLDGLLTAWMVRDKAHIKIYLFAPDEVRFKRIASREKMSFEEAKKQTLEREAIERERYRNRYNLNIDDLSIYDVIINTDMMPLKSNIKILIRIIHEYIKAKAGVK